MDDDSERAQEFPIFSLTDYDFQFQHSPWPIGLQSTFPQELIRRIAAALISVQAGNSGIDYTYKRYTKDKTYRLNDGSRLDWRISREIADRMRRFSDLIYQVTADGDKRQGETLSEWTFFRVPHSIELLLSCGHRGALFESAAIARMILEQIAWACAIDAHEDADKIKQTSATRAVGQLKSLCPIAGRLYGWLSVHTHWEFDGHVKAMQFSDERLMAVFASSEFKATSLALTILISMISVVTFRRLKTESITRIFNMDDGDLALREDGESFLGITFQSKVVEMQALYDHAKLLGLLEATKMWSPKNDDISDILEMASSLPKLSD